MRSVFNLPEEELLLGLELDSSEISLLNIERFECMDFHMSGVVKFVQVVPADQGGTTTRSFSASFTYLPNTQIFNGKEQTVLNPLRGNRCDKNAGRVSLTQPSDKPKGTVSSRKQPDGSYALTLKEVAENSEIRWLLPEGVESERTATGLRLALPKGIDKMVVKLLIADPQTGAYTVRKKTLKA